MNQTLKSIVKKSFVYKIYLLLLNKFRKQKKQWQKKWKKRKNSLYKYYTLKILYPRIYKKNARKPVDEGKVVFIENRFESLSNTFKVMYDTLKINYDFDLHCHFLREHFSSRDEYRRRCMDMVADIATAKYVFLAEAININCGFKIRPETVVTQLWHGCGAFKKFGFSNASSLFGGSLKAMEKYPYYCGYTNVTVSSPEVMWAYEEAMRYPRESGVIKPLGTSRTDIFFDSDYIKEAYEALYKAMPAARGKKVILYAPTFRGSTGSATSPEMPDIDALQRALGGKYVFLIKQHPIVKKRPAVPARNMDFARDVTDSMIIEHLLCVSDICISDYSSLIFEYSLFERPMIFFAEDIDEFLRWRGFYYEYHEFTPGPVVKNTEDIISYILDIDNSFDRQRVADFRQKFMSSCDGHSTERILDAVLTEQAKKQHRREVPLEKKKYHLRPSAYDK